MSDNQPIRFKIRYIPGFSGDPMPLPKEESVNHPPHYQGNKFEVIDIIEDFQLDFLLGNALKYILRAGKKDDMIQDLKKAIWYLERKCEKIGDKS